MKADDVSRIEESLQIVLPEAYRQLLASFPLPAYVGNVDTGLWDDAEHLIQLNRELRSGTGVKPWPAHMYAIGRDDGGCSQAIDLRTEDLWWVDRGHLDAPGTYKHVETIHLWADEYIKGLASDLTGEGGDPLGTPQQRAVLEAKNAGASARVTGLLVLFVVLAALAFGLWKIFRS